MNALICADQMYTRLRFDFLDARTIQIEFYKHIKRMFKKL